MNRNQTATRSITWSTQASSASAATYAINDARSRGCTCNHPPRPPITAHPNGWHVTLHHHPDCPALATR